MVLLLAISFVLLACFSIGFFFYFQIRKNKRSRPVQPDLLNSTDVGTCARCKQRRTIVQKDAGLCAFCWSSLNTKQVG